MAAPVSPSLTLPDDAAELLAEAQTRAGLLPDSFRHGSDCVIAKRADGKFVHQMHRSLRARVKAKKAAAALGA